LIEGNADLPRMIWGLGLDDSQPNHTQTYPIAAVTTSVDEKAAQARAIIRRPQILSPQQNQKFNPATQPIEVRKEAETWKDIPIHIHDPFLNSFRPCNLPGSLVNNGRAVNPTSDVRNDRVQHRDASNFFLSSPPVQVPSTQAAQYLSSRTFPEPRAGSRFITPSRLSAIDIAYKYHIEQQQNSLPTPPSSSTPRWSPTFSQYPFSIVHLPGYDFFDDQRNLSEQLPLSLIQGQAYLERHHQHALGKQGFGLGIVNNMPSNFYAPPIGSEPYSTRPTPVPVVALPEFLAGSLVPFKQPFRLDFEPQAFIHTATSQEAPRVSPAARREHRQLYAKRQPNTTGRPMQRRLSSVAEEEDSVAPNKPSFSRVVAPNVSTHSRCRVS
jgi:hypothetical protein